MTEKQMIWFAHKESCEKCLKACRLRFIQFPDGANRHIYKACCSIGKPLYKAFLDEFGDANFDTED